VPNDLLILADTLTLDPAKPRAGAVLVRAGKVAAVGTREDLETLGLEVLDHRGALLTPGLTDAHVHLVKYGFNLAELDLAETNSYREALALVAERAASLAEGAWLIGGGVDPNRWGLSDYPLAAWLDEVSPRNPVLLRTRDLHGAWVNSLTIRAAGLSAGTPDPAGGRIARTSDGSPAGMLLESAVGLVHDAMPAETWEETVAAARRAAKNLADRGFTSTHTMAAEPPEHLRAMLDLEAKGEMPLRIWACLPHARLEEVAACGLRGGIGRRVRLSGIKFFADGSLGSRTALMLEDFTGQPGNRGVAVDSADLIRERGRTAIELGFAPVVHAIGDRANREVLAVLEDLAPLAKARGVRLRLEHAQHLHPDDVSRFGRAGIIASVQPIHIVGDAPAIPTLLGEERGRWSYPFRSLLQSGATLALGSDAPVATPDPLAGWHAATERNGLDGAPFHQEEALTHAETLAGYTTGAAAAAGWENWYGRVSPGYAADFTLWDGDPSRGVAKPVQALSLSGE
jgi:predicted amidohydrolase YtcJ